MSWSIYDHVAAYDDQTFGFHWQLLHPGGGIMGLRNGATRVPVVPLKLTWQPPQASYNVQEFMVRGDELIVVYAPVNPQSSSLRLVWRVVGDGNVLIIDLTLSMHTEDWVCEPHITVVTEFLCPASFQPVEADVATEQLRAVSKGELPTVVSVPGFQGKCKATLARLGDLDLSYAEMVFPSDLGTGRFEVAVHRWTYPLIPERLERGVIRTARVRSVLSPRSGDEAAVVAALYGFLAASPPLTH